jgi:hypothetical protein
VNFTPSLLFVIAIAGSVDSNRGRVVTRVSSGNEQAAVCGRGPYAKRRLDPLRPRAAKEPSKAAPGDESDLARCLRTCRLYSSWSCENKADPLKAGVEELKLTGSASTGRIFGTETIPIGAGVKRWTMKLATNSSISVHWQR